MAKPFKVMIVTPDKIAFEGTSPEAVEAAKAKYRETGRAVGVTRKDDYFFGPR